jgi:hypothetical protein
MSPTLQRRMPAFALLCGAVAFGAFALTDLESRSLFLLIALGNLVTGLALWLVKPPAPDVGDEPDPRD